MGGTSAACHIAAGVAALVLSIKPNLTNIQVQDILQTTAKDLGTPGFDNSYGYGRVDASSAIEMVNHPLVEIIGSWLSGSSHAKDAGNNRALIFIAHSEHASSDMNLSSVTYGGQAMTKVIDRNYFSEGGYVYSAAYILKEDGIAAATSYYFIPTWSGTLPSAIGYAHVLLSNVDQTTPVGAFTSSGSTSNPVTTSSLATSFGDMVIDAATCGNAGSYTLGNGFIKGIDQTMRSTATGVTGHKMATGAAETPSATFSGSVNHQVLIGFVVRLSACSKVLAAGYGLNSDFNGDCYVNYKDLKIIYDYWLNADCTEPDNCGGADFEPRDGVVDLFDFSDFAVQWMLCNNPDDANCSPNW
jgi:hypothetical protein